MHQLPKRLDIFNLLRMFLNQLLQYHSGPLNLLLLQKNPGKLPLGLRQVLF